MEKPAAKNSAPNNLKEFAASLNSYWILEEWLHWPPDLFALTSLLLKRTGAYRYAVSPPVKPWPEENWSQQVEDAALCWQKWILGRIEKDRLTGLFRKNWAILKKHWQDVSLDRLGALDKNCAEWELCRAVLELHAVADHACGGFGHPTGTLEGPINSEWRSELSALYYLANMLLAITGSLSRLPRNKVIVLPKMRTPRVGITLRSLSHYVTAHESEVGIIWRSMPWINNDENTVNIMVVPWPYEMHAAWFRDGGDLSNSDRQDLSFFRYTGCDQALPVENIVAMVLNARKHVNRVHMIVFPELALKKSELEALQRHLAKSAPLDGMPMLVAGLRGDSCLDNEPGESSRFDTNQVVLSTFFAGRWYDMVQDKHHRWKLDKQQIKQYNLGRTLTGKGDRWEAIEITPRKITFLAPNDWLALCPLICEDLARLEPVSDLIRGVGPTLLVAILLDGPQLRERWPGRYASVLADDPGSSVLTVSSLGMAERAQSPDRKGKVDRTIALWKDLIQGWGGIELRESDQAVLMTIAADWTEEKTADGRSDGKNAGLFVLHGIERLKAGSHEVSSEGNGEAPHDDLLFGKALDIKELTRFTFLVDAALDVNESMLDNLQCWAIGEKCEGKDWLHRLKAGDAVWKLIAAGIRETYEEQRSQPGGYDPTAAQKNFGVFVDWLVHVLKSTQEEEENSNPFLHWSRLVDQIHALFQSIQQGSYLEDLERDEVLASIIRQHGDLVDDRRRVKIYSGLAILWAIHNRLANDRRHKNLDEKKVQLLRRIEKLLTIDYRPVLRREQALSTGTLEVTT